MSEPVKVALMLQNGNVTRIVSAGVPVAVVTIDLDTDGLEAYQLDPLPAPLAGEAYLGGSYAECGPAAMALAMWAHDTFGEEALGQPLEEGVPCCNGVGCSDCGPDLTADLYRPFRWLVDEMSMEPELAGGGCVQLRHVGPNGAYVLVTDGGGSGLPLPDSWIVSARPPATGDDEADPFLVYDSGHDVDGWAPITLRQAVAAACGVVAEYEPASVDTRPLFGVLAGAAADSKGSMCPETYRTYDEAEQAAGEARGPGIWACVVELRDKGAR